VRSQNCEKRILASSRLSVHQHGTTRAPTGSTFMKFDTGLVKIILTLMDCGIIYSPRNVCPGFKWYCCSLVIVC